MSSSKLESPGAAALLAGIVCYAFALTVTILLPVWLTNQDVPKVVGVDGVGRDVKPYSAVEARGREVYGRQVCFHCHSQFIRPVNEEDKRWGPVSQTGEYAFDMPHYFGTRRTGPDLHREGGLRVDDWHLAHFYNPRYTVPRSVMPAFPWLFDKNPSADDVEFVLRWLDTNGDGVISTSIGDDGGAPPEAVAAEVAKARALLGNKDPLSRIDRRGLLGVGKAQDAMHYNEEPESGDGLLTDYDGGPLANEDGRALIVYLQRLGTSIGQWRQPLSAPTPPRHSPFDDVAPRPRRTDAMRVHGFHAADAKRVEAAEKARAEWKAAVAAWDRDNPILAQRIVKGGELFQKHCSGCHGVEGRGNGPAAPFLSIRPRDFTVGKYKFRSTSLGSLPLDGDIYRALFRGLPGSSMPAWKELADEQLWLLVDYVKSLYEGDAQFNDRAKVPMIDPPERFPVNRAAELLRGRAVYLSGAGQCYNCHGLEGRADGPGWNSQASQYGGAMRPRDLRPRLRSEWAPELYELFGKKVERLAGAEAWKTLSQAKGYLDLAPTDAAKRDAFVLFLLGEGPTAVDVFGGVDAVKAAFGDRYAKLFDKGDDALDEVRMATATEKDRPALRMRNGVTSADLYRLVMTGIDGTAMKGTASEFWAPVDPKPEWDTGFKGPDKRFSFAPKAGAEVKLSITTNDPRLKAVGVTSKPNDKGQVEEFIKLQAGDDWALIHYLQWLMCEPRDRAGN